MKAIKIDGGIVVAEWSDTGRNNIPRGWMDVTGRSDGPFLGKIYDRNSDTFSDPPPPDENA